MVAVTTDPKIRNTMRPRLDSRATSVLALLVLLIAGASTWSVCPTQALAQPTISAEISPTAGQQDDLFIFTVKVSGAKAITTPPALTKSDDFEATFLGPQTSISIVNGVVDSRSAYVYQLSAKRSGRLKTPQLTITIDGQQLVSPALQVQVEPSPGSSQDGPPQDASDTPGKSQLFLKQSATPTTVFVGQQVVNTLSLYTAVDLAEFHLEDFTSDGFWQERLIDNDRSVTEINGTPYTRVDHAKALYPLSEGTAELPRRSVTAKVPVRSKRRVPSLFDMGDQFLDQFFQTVELKPVTLASEPITIHVQPLPTPPTDLAPLLGPIPLVGATSVRAAYNADPIASGEMKTVSIEVHSEGNLHPLKSLPISAPDGVKIYDEAPQTVTERSAGKVVMKRTFRYSLVPLRGGIVKLPPVRLSYFDPERKQYLTTSTAEISFPVIGAIMPTPSGEQGRSSRDESASSPAGDASGAIDQSALPIAPNLQYRDPSLLQRVSEMVSVQLALLVLAAAIAFSTLMVVFGRRSSREPTQRVTRRAVDNIASLSAFEQLLRTAIAERVPGTNANDAIELLRANVLSHLSDQELAQGICALLDEVEIVRYARGSADSIEILFGLKSRFKALLERW